MKKEALSFLLVFIFIFIISMISQALSYEIVGYYPNWQWYDRDKLVNPQTIPYDKLTFINYAFFKPESDGNISLTDSWADENLLLGEMDWSTNTRKEETSIIYQSHAHGVKILASIGGWTLSNNFPGIAADASKRSNFAHNCAELIRTYGFDGIDIDWEYPGYAEHNGTPDDKQNFNLLLQAIRDTLDALGNATGKYYYLTAALPADPDKIDNIDVATISDILDMLNIMTYDFHGAWDPITNHNSPLYAPAQGDPEFCVDAAYRNYIAAGAPKEKINLGAPFYGRSFAGGTELFGSHDGQADTQTWSEDDGMPLYYNILGKWSSVGAVRYWDDQAKVPYAIYNGGFLSYDDSLSIALKASYVVEKGANGLIIWEITGDYLEDGSTPLLDAINNVFNNAPTTSIRENLLSSNTKTYVNVYPNPFNPTTKISLFNITPNEKLSVKIYDINGNLVQTIYNGIAKDNVMSFTWNANGISTGIYFLKVTTNNINITKRLIYIK